MILMKISQLKKGLPIGRNIEAKSLTENSVIAHTLVVRLYRTGNFLQNILGCYSGTTQDSETNDISFESPIIEIFETGKKLGVTSSWEWPRPSN